MELDKTAATIAISVVIGFGILLASVAAMQHTTSKNYYEAVNRCTEAGGMWMPMHDSGTCIRR